MDIQEIIRELVIECKFTDDVFGYCIDSCIRQSWRCFEKEFALEFQEPVNKKKIRSYRRQREAWDILRDQFLTYVEPYGVYKYAYGRNGRKKYIYSVQYRFDEFIFTIDNVDKSLIDTERAYEQYGDCIHSIIFFHEPFSWEFCTYVMRQLRTCGYGYIPALETETSGGHNL